MAQAYKPPVNNRTPVHVSTPEAFDIDASGFAVIAEAPYNPTTPPNTMVVTVGGAQRTYVAGTPGPGQFTVLSQVVNTGGGTVTEYLPVLQFSANDRNLSGTADYWASGTVLTSQFFAMMVNFLTPLVVASRSNLPTPTTNPYMRGHPGDQAFDANGNAWWSDGTQWRNVVNVPDVNSQAEEIAAFDAGAVFVKRNDIIDGTPVNITTTTSGPDVTAPLITGFSAGTPSGLTVAVQITASDNVGVTGYKVTTSATPPTAGSAGWSAAASFSVTVGSPGTYTLYPWAKDAAGNVSSDVGLHQQKTFATTTTTTTGPTTTTTTGPTTTTTAGPTTTTTTTAAPTTTTTTAAPTTTTTTAAPTTTTTTAAPGSAFLETFAGTAGSAPNAAYFDVVATGGGSAQLDGSGNLVVLTPTATTDAATIYVKSPPAYNSIHTYRWRGKIASDTPSTGSQLPLFFTADANHSGLPATFAVILNINYWSSAWRVSGAYYNGAGTPYFWSGSAFVTTDNSSYAVALTVNTVYEMLLETTATQCRWTIKSGTGTVLQQSGWFDWTSVHSLSGGFQVGFGDVWDTAHSSKFIVEEFEVA